MNAHPTQSIMRRALVAAEDVRAFGAVAVCFGVEQDLDLSREQRDFGILSRDHGGELVGGALKMGDFFFECVHNVSLTVF